MTQTPGADALTAQARGLADSDPDRAQALLEKAIELDPGYAAAHLHLGELHGAAGDLEAARVCFVKALERDPQDAFAMHNIAVCSHVAGDSTSAISYLQRALQLQPRYWRSWQALGDVQRQSGSFTAALHAYRNLVALRPAPENLLRLGAARQLLADYSGAIEVYELILNDQPEHADALYNMATCNQALGLLDLAEDQLRTVLERDPGNLPASAALAGVHDKRGQYDEGLSLLKPLLASANAEPEIWVSYARLARNAGEAAGATEKLELALSEQPFTDADRSRVLFSAGALRDATGDYEQAFAHWREANSLRQTGYDRAAFEEGVRQIESIFTPAFFSSNSTAVNDDRRPVFIVGMPRSGSTLVERIIASHPQAASIGESPRLSQVAFGLSKGDITYPECITDVDNSMLRQGADYYLDGLPSATRVVDKMLSNFMHVGLIRLLFGNARIIHCTRHPLDIALSCFSNDFAGLHVAFAYNLDDIAHYFRCYRQVMNHWDSIDTISILPVSYEQIVSEQERNTRRLLEFVDLPYDPLCLKFHEQAPLANTASYAQVRRPIYTDAVDRHRHYVDQLQSVRDTLRHQLGGFE